MSTPLAMHILENTPKTQVQVCVKQKTSMEPLAHSKQAAAVVHTNSGR